MADPITEFSKALVALVAGAANQVVAVRTSETRHFSGMLWQSDLVVTSAQALPTRERYEIVLDGGTTGSATPVGRDPSTNVALLKLAKPTTSKPMAEAEAVAGAVAVALGSDGAGAPRARLGIVNASGAAWRSRRGGLIDRRIVLDVGISRAEEGGPVIAPDGARLGMSTFGPRRQVLVIPSATIARIVPLLLKDGKVQRGWLGAALHPVAIPDALHSSAGQSAGMMVMSVADAGPSATAGVLAGDILISVDGEPARRFRRLSSLLGPDSIGKQLDLRLIRGGAVISVKATITPRPET